MLSLPTFSDGTRTPIVVGLVFTGGDGGKLSGVFSPARDSLVPFEIDCFETGTAEAAASAFQAFGFGSVAFYSSLYTSGTICSESDEAKTQHQWESLNSPRVATARFAGKLVMRTLPMMRTRAVRGGIGAKMGLIGNPFTCERKATVRRPIFFCSVVCCCLLETIAG